MELPDCPPGAEGYHDSVTEVPKKLNDDCTKAEQEFQEHLNSLKIKLENGEARSMVERRGRDVSGKWIYLCYPCAAICSGESVLQTHISGKKHKNKLSMRNVWPISIFEEHPFFQNDKGKSGTASDKVLQKMAEEVDLYNKNPSDLDDMYDKYKNVKCHIQDIIDGVKAPLLGLEYLIEHPPVEAHYEPSYICTLCAKQGHPRTIINHMTCFWHRCNYLLRHFSKASTLLTPYRNQNKFREGVSVIMNRLAQRVEDKYGRLRPVNIEKEIYEKEREAITNWLFKGYHFSEKLGPTFEEVVDIGLITSLHKSNETNKTIPLTKSFGKKDPSPPVVAAPSKPHFNSFTRSATRVSRRAGSAGSLSDVSDEAPSPIRPIRERHDSMKLRYDPYDRQGSRNPSKEVPDKVNRNQEKYRAPNYEYKVKLAAEKRQVTEEALKKSLAYHEKNPEKHPLYPEEWKKFWNRRYKEIQTEGKDPSKHDFKPEWIKFWTGRMKELHEEEVRGVVDEMYRKLCLTPPDLTRRSPLDYLKPDDRKRSSERRRRSPEHRARSPAGRRRSPEPRRRSPGPRRRSPERRRSPPRRREPEPRHRSPNLRRLQSPNYNFDSSYRRELRSPNYGSPPRRAPQPPQHPRQRHSRSRSPIPKPRAVDSARRSRSPLSRRDPPRNRSPAPTAPAPAPAPAPSLQTVLISDDELNPDDGGLSPWNSDGDVDSVVSLPESSRSRGSQRPRRLAGSHSSHTGRLSHGRLPSREPDDLGPPENVVATLRMLVALEDYLGSIGPKLVDLLTEALKMEKERANSSEELLDRESAVVLIETGKEKLKGAVQAGLVGGGAAAAVRRAVVRCAATLHEADKRAHKKKKLSAAAKSVGGLSGESGVGAGAGAAAGGLSVCGVGEVDRAEIAQQMAAALIAQGKTDVSAEELAQLVDAVVGMAEAKKRDAAKNKTETAQSTTETAKMSGTASALQMLQSAYDENEKRIEKDDAPDAMDGLSDSDLETLLKNFNELSAEEQHSLIAYLKKLEAREPQRVERLRQYVSAAAASAPPAAAAPAPAPAVARTPAPALASAPAPESAPTPTVSEPVAVDSDDDDYTVEEVFKSATQKVKEDKIRQEMEIVKKSLEELKGLPSPVDAAPAQPEPAAAPSPAPALAPAAVVDLTNHISSAADLFALVQASIQSTSTTPASSMQMSDLVTTNMHTRSFGDNPEPLIDHFEPTKPLQRQSLSIPPSAPFINQRSGLQRSPMDQMNYRNSNTSSVDNEVYEQPPLWNSPIQNVSDDRGPSSRGPNVNDFASDSTYNQVNRGENLVNGRNQDTYDAGQSDIYQQHQQHQQYQQPRQPLLQPLQQQYQPLQQHQPLQQQHQPFRQQRQPLVEHRLPLNQPLQQQRQPPIQPLQQLHRPQQQQLQHHQSHQPNQQQQQQQQQHQQQQHQQQQQHNQPHQQNQQYQPQQQHQQSYGNHEQRNYGGRRGGGRGNFGGGQRGRGRGNYY